MNDDIRHLSESELEGVPWLLLWLTGTAKTVLIFRIKKVHLNLSRFQKISDRFRWVLSLTFIGGFLSGGFDEKIHCVDGVLGMHDEGEYFGDRTSNLEGSGSVVLTAKGEQKVA